MKELLDAIVTRFNGTSALFNVYGSLYYDMNEVIDALPFATVSHLGASASESFGLMHSDNHSIQLNLYHTDHETMLGHMTTLFSTFDPDATKLSLASGFTHVHSHRVSWSVRYEGNDPDSNPVYHGLVQYEMLVDTSF